MTSQNQSFQDLKQSARSVDDIAQWFCENLSIFPEIPVEQLNNVQVTLNEGTTSYRQEIEPHIVAHVSLVLLVEEPDNGNHLFTQATGCKVRMPTATTLFRKTVDFNLYAREWPFVMANVLWDYHNQRHMSFTANKKELVVKESTIALPNFSWTAYESLAQSDMVPTSYSEFFEWLFQMRAQHVVTIDPLSDNII